MEGTEKIKGGWGEIMNSELQGIKNILDFFPPQNKLMKFKIILKRPYHKLGCKHQ